MEFRYRINILCLIGAIIGFIAIFSAWIKIGSIFSGIPGLNLIDILNYSDTPLLYTGCLLFFIGTIIALFSPVGGILQIIGVPLFLTWFVTETEQMPSGVGSYLGLTSAVIVLISFAKPIGIGYEIWPISKIGRLLTFSKKKGIEKPVSEQISAESSTTLPSQPSEQIVEKFCHYCGNKLPGESEFCNKCGKKL